MSFPFLETEANKCSRKNVFTQIGLKCGTANDIKTGPLLILPLMDEALDVN